jgi:voltage-gated potassium channel
MIKPTDEETHGELQRLGVSEIAILVLSVYVLGALFAQTAFNIDPEVSLLMDRVDSFLCIFFLSDFIVRFRRAPSKLAFMKWGWIDLLSSLPAYDILRWGRLVRVVRIVRVFRAFRSSRHLVAFLFRHRVRSLALTAILTALILVILSSIAVLSFEDHTLSNIRTPFDAVWWAISTMTTVGYGDRVPVTTEGKVVAMILMVTGVGLFGVLTGIFARLFVEPDIRSDSVETQAMVAEMRKLSEKIERLEKSIEAAPPVKKNPPSESAFEDP